MKEKSVTATIKTKFDLGYILELDDGTEAQLRVIEQKGKELELHVASQEESIYGEQIQVYIVVKDFRGCLVSQYSPSERNEREKKEKLKQAANINCNIGNIFLMEIEKEYEWGYLCNQVGGYLSGAIQKPTKNFKIGQTLEVIVTAKSSNGSPLLTPTEEN